MRPHPPSLGLLPVAVVLLALPAQGGERKDPKREVGEVIARFVEEDPALTQVFEDAHGYAVFPTVGKGGLGLGAARGKGLVYERGNLVGRSALTQVTIGLQFGGQAYSEVVFFKTRSAFDSFKRGRLKFDAQVSAVALSARAAADLAWRHGVAIVTMAKGGLMYEASVGGQKFSFHRTDDEDEP